MAGHGRGVALPVRPATHTVTTEVDGAVISETMPRFDYTILDPARGKKIRD